MTTKFETTAYVDFFGRASVKVVLGGGNSGNGWQEILLPMEAIQFAEELLHSATGAQMLTKKKEDQPTPKPAPTPMPAQTKPFLDLVAKDGFHWLTSERSSEPVLAQWLGGARRWALFGETGLITPVEMYRRGWRYLQPCAAPRTEDNHD